MTSMKDREQGFENKFAHDEELKFKIEARRTKLIGLWAADLMGLNTADAATYAQALVKHDLKEAGSADVVRQLTADLQAKGIDPQSLHLEKKMAEFLEAAKDQVMAS